MKTNFAEVEEAALQMEKEKNVKNVVAVNEVKAEKEDSNNR